MNITPSNTIKGDNFNPSQNYLIPPAGHEGLSKITPEFVEGAMAPLETPMTEKNSADYYIKLAKFAFQQSNFEIVCVNYEKAISLDKTALTEIDMQRLLEAYKYVSNYYYSNALKQYRQQSTIAQSSPDAYNPECTLLYKASMDYLKKYVQLKGEISTTDDYKQLGNACYNSKHYRDALGYFKKSLELFPLNGKQKDLARLYTKLAETSYQLNDFAIAIHDYKIAIHTDKKALQDTDYQKLHKMSHDYWNQAVRIMKEQHKNTPEEYTTGCLNLFRLCMDSQNCYVAVKGEKSIANDYRLLGNACFNSKYYKEALEPFKKCLELFPSNCEAKDRARLHVKLAETSYQLNDFAFAAENYKIAINTDKMALTALDYQKLKTCEEKLWSPNEEHLRQAGEHMINLKKNLGRSPAETEFLNYFVEKMNINTLQAKKVLNSILMLSTSESH